IAEEAPADITDSTSTWDPEVTYTDESNHDTFDATNIAEEAPADITDSTSTWDPEVTYTDESNHDTFDATNIEEEAEPTTEIPATPNDSLFGVHSTPQLTGTVINDEAEPTTEIPATPNDSLFGVHSTPQLTGTVINDTRPATKPTAPAKGELADHQEYSDGSQANFYHDGNGGMTQVKTRPDGSIVTIDANGTVINDTRPATVSPKVPFGPQLPNEEPIHFIENDNIAPLYEAKSYISPLRYEVTAYRLLNAGEAGREAIAATNPIKISKDAKDAWDSTKVYVTETSPGFKPIDAIDKGIAKVFFVMDAVDSIDAILDGDVNRAVTSGGAATIGGWGVLANSPASSLASITWYGSNKVVGPLLEESVRDTQTMENFRTAVGEMNSTCGQYGCDIAYTVVAGLGTVVVATTEEAANHLQAQLEKALVNTIDLGVRVALPVVAGH
ncbi:hypothetical protein QVA66_10405, partial [Staphylococcus chromogenes]|nr:hypothetical protein [Staphylococcus chromogenes]